MKNAFYHKDTFRMNLTFSLQFMVKRAPQK